MGHHLILFPKSKVVVFTVAKNANSSLKNSISKAGFRDVDVITRFQYDALISLDGGNHQARPLNLHFGNLSWIELERYFPAAFKKISA